MNPGELNRKLNFKKLVEETDATGAPYKDYEHDFFAWGKIVPNSGQQIFRSAKYESEVDGYIDIYYRIDLTADHIIEDIETGDEYEVESYFDPNGRKEKSRCIVKKVI